MNAMRGRGARCGGTRGALLGLACAAALLGENRRAAAGGYAYPELGTAALARGGAFVARADDPTALYYNPAGAARLQGTQLLVDANVLVERVLFQRRQYSDPAIAPQRYPSPLQAELLPAVRNSDGPAIAPFVGLTSDLGVLRPYHLVLMAGIYGPNSHPTRSYPRSCAPGSDPCEPAATGLPAPSRYETTAIDIFAIHPTIGLAWQPLPGLSFGAALLLSYLDFHYETVISALSSENPASDLPIAVDATTAITPTALLGVHWAPLSFLELGASLRLGFNYDASGPICIGERQPDGSCDLPESLRTQLLRGTEITTRPNPVTVDLRLPDFWVVRGGLRYVQRDGRGRERFDVELDFVWESTSDLQQYTAELRDPVKVVFVRDGNVFKEVTRISLEHRWQDSWSLRLGGSYTLHELLRGGALTLRGGGLYESGAVPAAYTRLNFLPLARVGLGLGLGLRWGRYELDLAYMRLLHVARDVDPPAGAAQCSRTLSEDCGSDVKQLAPLVPSQLGAPIGNGRYEVSIDELSFGGRVVF